MRSAKGVLNGGSAESALLVLQHAQRDLEFRLQIYFSNALVSCCFVIVIIPAMLDLHLQKAEISRIASALSYDGNAFVSSSGKNTRRLQNFSSRSFAECCVILRIAGFICSYSPAHCTYIWLSAGIYALLRAVVHAILARFQPALRTSQPLPLVSCMMLLRFSSLDVCNATLTEATTGEVAYRISTTRPRSSSRTSFMSISSRSQDGQSPSSTDHRTTVMKDSDGEAVAEIVWEANCASRIRIRDEEMRGTSELFDAAFVKVL